MIDRILKAITSFSRRIRQRMQRKPQRFLERLRQQAHLNVEAASAFDRYLDKPSNKNTRHIRELEKNGDEIRRILIDELNRTFVTPIDREDIYTLSRVIDDILDDLWSTVNEMDILNVEPNDILLQMAELLGRGAEEIKLAIDRLPQHPGVASAHAIRARAIDNQMEVLYAEALADLFQAPTDLSNIVMMLKLREIYRHLFHASGRVADAANVIEDIIVKFY
ncbi:MAG: DUF47 family protein [Anaerolineae bacterium]|nr:DUF47 family protein [Anaerolineae bacterium]